MGSGRGSRIETIKRAFRTAYFMIILIVSLLVSSAPLLVSIIDTIAPCILLSTFASCSSCFRLNRAWQAYSFRTSLVDVPLLSLVRSLANFGAYSMCGIPYLTYGPYLGTAAASGMISAILLVVKSCVFVNFHLLHAAAPGSGGPQMRHQWSLLALFLCSMVLAIGHIIVAYKIRRQARRKMHIYRLDQEAVNSLINPLLYARFNERYRRQPVEEASFQGQKAFKVSV